MIDLTIGKGSKMCFDMRGVTEKLTIEGQLFSFEESVKDGEEKVQEFTEAGTGIQGKVDESELGIETDEEVHLRLEKEWIDLDDSSFF